MTRWNPKERRGAAYDPVSFVETPEQARRLMSHLEQQLTKARQEKNAELIKDIKEVLLKVESLAQKFFRWEAHNERALQLQEMREIRKLPVRF
jgi:polyhydroxyalkanoate synthesis regulator phasin